MIENLVDTHFHLDYYRNHAELFKTINQLKQQTLCMTSSPGVFLSCKSLYGETKYVKFALGYHPRANELTSRDFSDFLRLLDRTTIVGEVGMDFSSTNYLPKDKQLDYFEQIIRTCSAKDKLVSIHLKKSENEAVEILKKYRPTKCIVHWFSGTVVQLKALTTLGCYFSINTNMVAVQSSLSKLSLISQNKLLIESDGPFTKVDGKKYTPDMLQRAYQIIAERLQIPDLVNVVYSNYEALL